MENFLLGTHVSPRRYHGVALLLEGISGLRDDSGSVSGDHPETSGCAGRYAPQKYHLEGKHQHFRQRNCNYVSPKWTQKMKQIFMNFITDLKD